MINLNTELSLIEEKYIESRRHPRLDVDLGTTIEFLLEDDEDQVIYKAFVLDISMGGCGIITFKQNVALIKENAICYINDPDSSHILTKTQIRWIKETQNDGLRIGLKYID